MQAPTPEFTDVGASLFAGVMLQLLQYVKSHTLSSLLVHIAKLSFRWQQERHAKGYALFVLSFRCYQKNAPRDSGGVSWERGSAMQADASFVN